MRVPNTAAVGITRGRRELLWRDMTWRNLTRHELDGCHFQPARMSRLSHASFVTERRRRIGGIPCRASALYCTARQPGYRLEGIAASESSQEAPTEAGMVPSITTDPGHNTSRGLGDGEGRSAGHARRRLGTRGVRVEGGMGSLFPTKALIPRTHV